MADRDLYDLGFHGRWFTWEHGNFAATNVREILDRGVANPTWSELFLFYRIDHLVSPCSDHCPILLNTIAFRLIREEDGYMAFKFEVDWLLEDSCSKKVATL